MSVSATKPPTFPPGARPSAADASIANDPRFRELVAKRNGLATVLSIIMMAIYLGFIFLVAFDKPLLATKIAGTTSLGILLGLLVIISAVVLTGIYVTRANGRFDELTGGLTRDYGKGAR